MNRSGLTWIVLLLVLTSGTIAGLLVGDLALPEAYLELWLWRLGNAGLAGAALATGGVLVQALFRDPLTSPSILGTTGGASLGGILVGESP